jgi:hypothetical protein
MISSSTEVIRKWNLREEFIGNRRTGSLRDNDSSDAKDLLVSGDVGLSLLGSCSDHGPDAL